MLQAINRNVECVSQRHALGETEAEAGPVNRRDLTGDFARQDSSSALTGRRPSIAPGRVLNSTR
jgi:hypothetical protein